MTKTRSWIWYGLGACATGLAFLFLWQHVASHKDLATQRNAYIEREIAKLKLQVVEIKDLGEIVAVYDAMARAANVVHQRRTVYAAEALAELSRLPKQIVLTSVTVANNRLTMIGEAASEPDLARVQPTLAKGRFITKVRIEEAVPLAGGRRFRLEMEITAPSPSPTTPMGKQQ